MLHFNVCLGVLLSVVALSSGQNATGGAANGTAAVVVAIVPASPVTANAAGASGACGSPGVTCIGLPTGCAKAEASCDVLAKVSVAGDFVHVDLSALSLRTLKLSLTGRWIAVGFSEDGQMGKSPVLHCYEDGGQAQAKLTYNSDLGYFNQGWAGIDQTQLSVLKTAVDANALSCSVNIKRKVGIQTFTFDLAGTKHSLITATGPLVAGSIKMHDIGPESSFPDNYLF